MTRQQFKILLDQISNNLDNTHYISGYEIESLTSSFNNGVVEITKHSKKIVVSIRVGSFSSLEESIGTLYFLFGICFFSLSWWRWQIVCLAVERNLNKKILEHKRKKEKTEIEEIDKAIIEVFPEVLEDEIFGDD